MSNMDGHIDRLVFRRRCIRYVSSSAQNGRFELYKTTADHEAEVGRKTSLSMCPSMLLIR